MNTTERESGASIQVQGDLINIKVEGELDEATASAFWSTHLVANTSTVRRACAAAIQTHLEATLPKGSHHGSCRLARAGLFNCPHAP